jgi:hypothetical protein
LLFHHPIVDREELTRQKIDKLVVQAKEKMAKGDKKGTKNIPFQIM